MFSPLSHPPKWWRSTVQAVHQGLLDLLALLVLPVLQGLLALLVLLVRPAPRVRLAQPVNQGIRVRKDRLLLPV